jgi:serine/threonine protein kinase
MAEQPSTGASLIGATLGERYVVTREMGRGAMGTVYEARHAVISRRFAIKVLKQSCSTAVQRERFFHEARAAGAISHPHIVPVQDFGLAPDGAPYLVMEYVDGISLQTHMENTGKIPPAEAIEICAQVLSALEVIHGAGLVHRDLKPANIMLMRSARPRIFARLLDFGIARAINPSWGRPDLTRVDQILGTPAYLSPEQAGGGQPDPRWDLWALATILYEMLAGRLPFRLESLEQVAHDIMNCRLVPLRERSPELDPWILQVQARAHHPVLEQRYRTATAFLQALDERNASPEGVEDSDARTVPFQRVDLHTPPPELMNRLTGKAEVAAEPARERELGRVLRISPTGGREREVAQLRLKDPTGPGLVEGGPVKSSAGKAVHSGSIGPASNAAGGGEAGRARDWEGKPTRPERPPSAPRKVEHEEALTVPVERLSFAELQQSGSVPLPGSAISGAGPATSLTRAGGLRRGLLVAIVLLALGAVAAIVYLIASG